MVKRKTAYSIFILFLGISSLLLNRGCAKRIPQESDEAKAFEVLKAKMIDPKIGLPKTLDPILLMARIGRVIR